MVRAIRPSTFALMFDLSRFLLFFSLLGLLLQGCGSTKPSTVFDQKNVPAAPDYTNLNYWAAHPQKADPADRLPSPSLSNRQDSTGVDVFFLYPTTYYDMRRPKPGWNASLDNAAINKRTDSIPILFQATIFNGAGRVFAPRYRQAHLHSFFTKDKKSAEQALDVAYEDVRAAFLYYLEHWNEGRPFIIAGHSQGGRHGMFLLRDFIENTPLEQRLVAAYIVGWPVKPGFFQHLKPCESPQETDCFCTWRTWERKYALKHATEDSVICTNPVLWTTEPGKYAPKSLHRGAVLRKFNVVFPNLCDAEVYRGVLLCNKPKFPGSFFFRRKNYHIGDLNLYYFNVRENAEERVRAFGERRYPSGN
jgi:hypothetical protein